MQVTCEYIFEDGAAVPLRVHTVVVAASHDPEIELDELRVQIKEKVIKAVIPAKYLDDKTIYHINACGLFIIGGPQVRILVLTRNVYVYG